MAEVARLSDALKPEQFFSKDLGLNVPLLGDLIRREDFVTRGGDARLYHYRGGVYLPNGEDVVKARVREILGERFKARHVSEVLAWLSTFPIEVGQVQPEGLLNVRNGLLDWRAMQLREHTPEVISTVQLPVAWRPKAKCRRIESFLADVLPEDALDFIFELVGYALYPGNPFRMAVLLLGPGRNGKTVLLLVMRALLGEANVSAVPLQVLAENRFAAAELYGKTANICGDLDARAVRQTDIFKMIVGGDAIPAERKHRDAFTFTPFALLLFSANEPPISSDQTEAWFDRWVIVPMERRISEDCVDPHLVAKLTTEEELEGLLVRAVEGLRRVMARGRFDLPASIEAGRAAYREKLDTVTAFVAEECVFHLEAWTPRPQLYRAYRTWAQESGRFPVSSAVFNDHLRRGFEGRIAEITRRGTRGWGGIGLRAGEEG